MAIWSRTTKASEDTIKHLKGQRGARLADADQRAAEASWAPTSGVRGRLLGKAAANRKEARQLSKEIRRRS